MENREGRRERGRGKGGEGRGGEGEEGRERRGGEGGEERGGEGVEGGREGREGRGGREGREGREGRWGEGGREKGRREKGGNDSLIGRHPFASPDECAIILGQVERAGETELIKSLSECSDSRLCQGLQRLIQDTGILSLQETQKTQLKNQTRKKFNHHL